MQVILKPLKSKIVMFLCPSTNILNAFLYFTFYYPQKHKGLRHRYWDIGKVYKRLILGISQEKGISIVDAFLDGKIE